MIDTHRRAFARFFSILVHEGVPRKRAMLSVLQVLREADVPSSSASIYRWCAEFEIPTR